MPKYQDKVTLKKASPILTEEKPAEEAIAERLSPEPDETRTAGSNQGNLGVASKSDAETEANEGFPIAKPKPGAGSAKFLESGNINRHRNKAKSFFQPFLFCIIFLVASFGLAKGAFLGLDYLRTDVLLQAAADPSTSTIAKLLDRELYSTVESVLYEPDKDIQLAEAYFYIADRLPNPDSKSESLETQEAKKHYYQKSLNLFEKYKTTHETLAELKALKPETTSIERYDNPRSNYRRLQSAAYIELLMGESEAFHNNNQKALQHFNNAVELYSIAGNKSSMTRLYDTIGRCKYNLHDYKGALQAFESEKNLSERVLPRYFSELEQLNFMIGKCYFKLANYVEAERVLQKTNFRNNAPDFEKQRLEILKRIDKSKRKG
ncbi:MAG: hypothetical protein K2X81_22500 [Candidatus Obscuribacterales bacterium]|nr:hypothetical protein [Candidatus Obscuribacterales bacterium]